MKLQFMVLLMFSLLVPQVWAQSNTGNGGRAIVCFSQPDPVTGAQQVVSARLTDLEESVLSKWTISVGEDRVMAEADAYSAAIATLEKVKRLDSILANELQNIVLQMQKERHLLYWQAQGLTINKIRDANTEVKSVNENCLELQAAFNKTKPDPMEYRFVFVGNVIEKMTNRHLTALILHEALYYREALLGATSSDGLRRVVRAMASAELETLSSRVWFEVASNSLKRAHVQEGDLIFSSVSSWLADGRVEKGVLVNRTVNQVLFKGRCSKSIAPHTSEYTVANVPNWTFNWANYLRLPSGEEGAFGFLHPYPGLRRAIDTRDLFCKDGKIIERDYPHNLFDPDTIQAIQSVWPLRDQYEFRGFYSELARDQPNLSVVPDRDRRVSPLHHQEVRISQALLVWVSYLNGQPERAIVFLSPSSWKSLWPQSIRYSVKMGQGPEQAMSLSRYQGIEYRIINHRLVDSPQVVELPEAVRGL